MRWRVIEFERGGLAVREVEIEFQESDGGIGRVYLVGSGDKMVDRVDGGGDGGAGSLGGDVYAREDGLLLIPSRLCRSMIFVRERRVE